MESGNDTERLYCHADAQRVCGPDCVAYLTEDKRKSREAWAACQLIVVRVRTAQALEKSVNRPLMPPSQERLL